MKAWYKRFSIIMILNSRAQSYQNKSEVWEIFSDKNLKILNPQIFSENLRNFQQNILVQLAGQIYENFPQNIFWTHVCTIFAPFLNLYLIPKSLFLRSWNGCKPDLFILYLLFVKSILFFSYLSIWIDSKLVCIDSS